MAQTSEVVIIGGGAAGCAVAYYLAKAGVKSTIVEREGIGSKASGFSAGGLNPLEGAGIPGPLGPMAMESFQMHQAMYEQLIEESGVDFQLETVSQIRIAFDESELPELQATLDTFQAAKGFAAHWMDAERVYDLEPRIAPCVVRALYAHGNVALNSLQYTTALSKAAESLGASIHAAQAIGVSKSGDSVTGVTLEDGEIACDAVVIASGPWSGDAEQWLGVNLPVKPYKGEILRMEHPGEPLQYEFSSGGVNLFKRRDGLLWVGATEEDKGFDIEPSEPARNHLLDGATRIIPAMANAKIVKHTACLRPLCPDWLPIVGQAPGWENVYLATGAGKKGILISPGIGKATADLITTSETQLPIGPFSPERFAGESK